MADAFPPSNDVADDVAAVLAGVDHLGYSFRADEGTVTVRLARDVAAGGLPALAAGYPVSYRTSVMTRTEIESIKTEVVDIGGSHSRFAVGYDVHRDRVAVNGYFPDEDVIARLSALVNVELSTVGRYVETDAEWRQRNDVITRTAPTILDAWSEFPVDGSPRPTVLLDIPVRAGFLDTVPTPNSGPPAVVSSVPLPEGLLPLLTRNGAPPGTAPLHLTGVLSTRSWFMTDRGQRQLPAYELSFAEGHNTCIVLDPAAPLWWPRTRNQWLQAHRCRTARAEPDDVTLHLNVAGGQLPEVVSVEVHESRTAVLAIAITREGAGPRRGVGRNYTTTTVLPNPLGDRLLLDERGVPCIVVPVGTSLRPRWWPDAPLSRSTGVDAAN